MWYEYDIIRGFFSLSQDTCNHGNCTTESTVSYVSWCTYTRPVKTIQK